MLKTPKFKLNLGFVVFKKWFSLPRVRLELTTLGLWDLRAAYCATEAMAVLLLLHKKRNIYSEIDWSLDAGSTCFQRNRLIIQWLQESDLPEIGHLFIEYCWCGAVFAFRSLCDDLNLNDDLFTIRVTVQKEQLSMAFSSLIRQQVRSNRGAFIAARCNKRLNLIRFGQLCAVAISQSMTDNRDAIFASWKLEPMPRRDAVKYSRHRQFLFGLIGPKCQNENYQWIFVGKHVTRCVALSMQVIAMFYGDSSNNSIRSPIYPFNFYLLQEVTCYLKCVKHIFHYLNYAVCYSSFCMPYTFSLSWANNCRMIRLA